MTKARWLLLTLIVVASSAWIVLAAGELSATFDETTYVRAGLNRWRTGDVSELMRLGTMPLPVDISALAPYVAERLRGAPFDTTDPAQFSAALRLARPMTLLFWWLLLGAVFVSARSLAGPDAGLLAAASIAVEPSFLAHAALATTDIASTACLVAFGHAFASNRQRGWFRRVLIPALWFAAATLAKATGPVYGVLIAVAIECSRLPQSPAPARSDVPWVGRLRAALSPLRNDLASVFGLAMAIVFVYVGSDWALEPRFVQWAQRLPDGAQRDVLLPLAEHLRIFPNAGEGLVQQVRHNLRGHDAFIFGQFFTGSVWWYFPLVFTIKFSEPLLLVPVCLVLMAPRQLANWALVAAGLLLLFSVSAHVQIGARFLLPMVAFLVIGCAAAAFAARRASVGGIIARFPLALLLLGVVWTGVASVRHWPDALRYTNDAWGGSDNGWTLLADSNYDWGQGLIELRRLAERRPGEVMHVWYFGTDPNVNVAPLALTPLHQMPAAPDPLAAVRGRRLAVSTTLFAGAVQGPAFDAPLEAVRRLHPVARTRTFLILDVPPLPSGR